MKFSYFPGCSLKGLGRAYEESLLPVMQHLGVELQELDDWNCCGATAYMAVDEVKACVMASRNLALAEQQTQDTRTLVAVSMGGRAYSRKGPTSKASGFDTPRRVTRRISRGPTGASGASAAAPS